MWTTHTRLSITRSVRLTGNNDVICKYKRVWRLPHPLCIQAGCSVMTVISGGQLRRKGRPTGADAAVHVKLQLVEAEVALDVLFSEGWEDERPDEGESYLAAVGVACEHQVDEWAAGMLHDVVGVVGLVRHEDDGAIGLSRVWRG